MLLKEAENIANKYVELFRPYCRRIEIAGSIRRKCQEVKDIEIVCIADTYKLEQYFVFNKRQFHFTKNGAKYKQFMTSHAINLDLFICNMDTWGIIYLIRTGSAEFVREFMQRIRRKGHCCKEGYIYRMFGSKKNPEESLIRCKPFYEEKEVFDYFNFRYFPPESRNK